MPNDDQQPGLSNADPYNDTELRFRALDRAFSKSKPAKDVVRDARLYHDFFTGKNDALPEDAEKNERVPSAKASIPERPFSNMPLVKA